MSILDQQRLLLAHTVDDDDADGTNGGDPNDPNQGSGGSNGGNDTTEEGSSKSPQAE